MIQTNQLHGSLSLDCSNHNRRSFPARRKLQSIEYEISLHYSNLNQTEKSLVQNMLANSIFFFKIHVTLQRLFE